MRSFSTLQNLEETAKISKQISKDMSKYSDKVAGKIYYLNKED